MENGASDRSAGQSPALRGEAMAASASSAGVLQRLIAKHAPQAGANASVISPERPAAEQSIERAASSALGRAAQKLHHLPVFVEKVVVRQASVAELIEILPERALLAVIEGKSDAIGVMAVCPGLLTSIIEIQAIGRVSKRPVPTRLPTRTDAAISADFVNAFLSELGLALMGGRPSYDFSAFRYATYLDDPRPLGLMLDEQDMTLLTIQFRAGAGGQRDAELLVALPLKRPEPPKEQDASRPSLIAPPIPGIQAPAAGAAINSLAEAMQSAPIQLEAILGQRQISLQELRRLKPGDLLALPANAVQDVKLQTAFGQPITTGQLGEAEGRYALRISNAQRGENADNLTEFATPILTEPPLSDLGQPDPFRNDPVPATMQDVAMPALDISQIEMPATDMGFGQMANFGDMSSGDALEGLDDFAASMPLSGLGD